MKKHEIYSELQQVKLKLNEQIAENKQLKNKLKEKDKSFNPSLAQKFLDIASVMIIAIDKNGIVNHINQKGCEILGYKHEDIIGKNWFDTFLPTNVKIDVKQVFNSLIKGDIKPAEYNENTILKKNGEKRLIAWYNTYLTNSKGNITGTLSSGMDITEQKKLEQELLDSEKKYKTLFENGYAAMLLIDSQNGKIIDANTAATKFYGWTYAELTKMKISEINTLSQKKIEEEMNLAQQQKRNHFFFVHKLADNTLRDVEVYSAPIIIKGKPLLYSIIHDITDRKLTEIKIRDLAKFPEENTNPVYRISKNGIMLFANTASKILLPHYFPESGKIVNSEWKNKINTIYKLKKRKTEEINIENKIFLFEIVPIFEHGYINIYASDITEQKIAEKALKESENKYRKLIETASDAIYLVSSKGIIIETNMAASMQLNRTIKEIKMLTIGDVDPNYPLKEFLAFCNNIPENEPQTFETTHIRKDNTLFPVEVCVSKFRVSDEYFFYGIARDISHRKHIEKELIENEKKYRLLFDYAGMGIGYYTLDGITISLNNRACDNLGGKLKNYIGKSLKEIFGDNGGKKYMDRIKKTTKSDIPLVFEDNITLKNADKWLRSTYCLINDAENNPIGIQIITDDITEQKNAEFNLINSEARYKELFNNIISGVAIYDVINNGDDFIFKDFNKAGEIIDGDKKENLIGKSIFDVRPGIEKFGLIEVFKRVWKTGSPEFHPSKIYKDNKLEKWHENFIYKLPGNEIVAVFNDITDKQLAEKELKDKTVELQNLARHMQDIRENEKKILAREMHDNLGQLLTAVKLDLSLIKNNIKENKKQSVSAINSTLKLVDQGIHLTHNITSNLRPGIIDNLGLLPAIDWYTGQLAIKSNLKINLNFSIIEEDINNDYKIHIYRIIQESLTNIIRHAKANKVSIKFYKESYHLVLEIKDNGKGIKKTDIKRSDAFGLIGIRERAYTIGGSLEINGIKNKGTKIKIII